MTFCSERDKSKFFTQVQQTACSQIMQIIKKSNS